MGRLLYYQKTGFLSEYLGKSPSEANACGLCVSLPVVLVLRSSNWPILKKRKSWKKANREPSEGCSKSSQFSCIPQMAYLRTEGTSPAGVRDNLRLSSG